MKPPAKFIVLDFEWACPNVDLEEAGVWVQTEDPTFEIICCSFGYCGGPAYTWTPDGREHEELLREFVADAEVAFVSHGEAEIAVWRNQMMPWHGFPDVANERWHDTLSVCAVKGLPLALENVVQVLRLPAKDTEGSKFTVGLSTPDKHGYFDRSPESLQRVVTYCESDYDGELALLQRIGWMPGEHVPAFHAHRRMTQRGIYIDQQYVSACRKIVADATIPLIAEFAELTKCSEYPKGLKPTQRDKVLTWLRHNGVKIDDYRKETIAKLLGQDIDDTGDDDPAESAHASPARVEPGTAVARALQIRQLTGSASVKKLARMAASVGRDGRSRGMSQYNGALPGRSSGRGWNPYNFPRGTIKVGETAPGPDIMAPVILSGDYELVEMTIGPAVECVVSGLRHGITAEKGNVLMSGDYAGIQARVVLAKAGQYDLVQKMAAGRPIYIEAAERVFKRPIDKKKDPAEYTRGKNIILGSGFGMGAKTYHVKYCPNRPMSEAEEDIRFYREDLAPEVPKLWKGLQNAAIRALQTKKPAESHGIEYRIEDIWLTARLPSGRKLWYPHPKLVKRRMPWDLDDIRLAWTFQSWKNNSWRTVNAFGGLQTENVVMGIEVDIQRVGIANVEKHWGPSSIAHECYDEVLAEVEEHRADKVAFRQCLLDMPRWVRDEQIPVDVPIGDIWVGARYRK